VYQHDFIFFNVIYVEAMYTYNSVGVCYCGIQCAVFTHGRCAIIRTVKLERVGNNA